MVPDWVKWVAIALVVWGVTWMFGINIPHAIAAFITGVQGIHHAFTHK